MKHIKTFLPIQIQLGGIPIEFYTFYSALREGYDRRNNKFYNWNNVQWLFYVAHANKLNLNFAQELALLYQYAEFDPKRITVNECVQALETQVHNDYSSQHVKERATNIIRTVHNNSRLVTDNEDCFAVSDCNFFILASNRYKTAALQIYDEYSHLGSNLYKKRIQFLTNLIEREAIFYILKEHEENARYNIEFELSLLKHFVS